MPATFPVYVEVGSKKVFATALNWPGWSRSAKTEDDVLRALFEYGPRYAKVVTRLGFVAPRSASAFTIDERIKGDAGTDYGVPEKPSSKDGRPIKSDELDRLVAILQRCWTYFDETASANKRRSLRTGPRGGGRSVAAMIEHVADADVAYLAQLGSKPRRDDLRATFVEMLKARARGEEPPTNPRKKKPYWTPRYAIRRSAWHALDHA
ncbi:MAG TPA: hypothetical protein VJ818_01430 [Actinomycetota bacterium]|nr:hypothetical protein [Actinomycetota bacterium]